MSQLFTERVEPKEKPKVSFYCNQMGCPKAGTISHNTRGGGPWYCADHFFFSGQQEQKPVQDPKPEPYNFNPDDLEVPF